MEIRGLETLLSYDVSRRQNRATAAGLAGTWTAASASPGRKGASLLRQIAQSFPRQVRFPASTIVLALAAYAFTAPYAVALAEGPFRNESRYGAIIDAGSTGSRLAIFEWRIAGDGGPHVWPVVSVEDADDANGSKCLVTSLLQSKRATCDCLLDLTERARTQAIRFLGESGLSSIPLWLKATGGVRSQDAKVRTKILRATAQCLSDSPGYAWRGAEVISGYEEGVFAWLAVNHLARTLRADTVAETYGIIELGGASAQVAYRVPALPSRTPRLGEVRTIRFATKALHIYVLSDALGTEVAKRKMTPPTSCALDQAPSNCVTQVRKILCPQNGKCQGLELPPPSGMRFAGLSAFRRVVQDMGLGPNDALETVRNRAHAICGPDKDQHLRDAVLTVAGKYKGDACFYAFYTIELAQNRWSIPLDMIKPPSPRWAADPAWPLGAMILEAARSAEAGRSN